MEAAKPKPAPHASPRPECPQLVASLADKPVARFRHLVPGPGEVDNRFRDDNPCLVGHLLQAWTFRVHLPHRAHLGAVVERARTPLARVPERPHALPISRRDRHLEGVLDAVAAPCLLHQTGHPLDCAWRVVFKAQRKREKEQQLRIRRPFDGCIQRLIYGECELTLDAREVAHEAVVDPEPSAIAERVAVGLLDGRPGRGTDVRQKERRLRADCGRSKPARHSGRWPVRRRLRRTNRHRSRPRWWSRLRGGRGDSGRSGSARACRAAPRGGSGSPSRRASGTSSAPLLLRVDLRRSSISRPIDQDLHLTGYESSIRLYRSPHTILYGAGWPSLALLLQHLLVIWQRQVIGFADTARKLKHHRYRLSYRQELFSARGRTPDDVLVGCKGFSEAQEEAAKARREVGSTTSTIMRVETTTVTAAATCRAM